MRSFLNSTCILLVVANLAVAQNTTPKPALTTRPEKATAAPSGEGNLPSEATVDAFLHEQFGYEADLTWKISSIRPSPVAGLAEVTVVLASPQGQQLSKFYVAPD